MIQWIGGLGVIVIFVAILPSLGTGGKKMYLTESTGPTPEGLRPHARETARVILLVYLGFTLLEFPILLLCGHVGLRRGLPHLHVGRHRRVLHPERQRRRPSTPSRSRWS